MSQWMTIESAPRDGRPVWVRGNNWGDPERGQHCLWAYWNGSDWVPAGVDAGERLLYLTDYLPEGGQE